MSKPTSNTQDAIKHAKENYPDEKEKNEFISRAAKRIDDNGYWRDLANRMDPED